MKHYRVIILKSAYNDLKQARQWYMQHNTALPKKLSEQINLTIGQIATAPFTHTTRYKNVRIANIATFPYAIHYLIEEELVVIIGIYHTAISPAKWNDRT